MSAKIFPIPAFKDNYIWMWINEADKTAWVVDPGDAAPVIAELEKLKLNLAGILLTHHHHDHSGGITTLKKRWENAFIYASSRSLVTGVTHPVKEGDAIIAPPFRLKVLEIPGHTLDHLAYYNDEVVFCGDTLFSAGCGRVFEGTPPQMYASLQKLANLSGNVSIYCGHEYTEANLNFARLVEPDNAAIIHKQTLVKELRAQNKPTLPSLLKEELSFNPFLRCTESKVIKTVEQNTNKKLTTPEAVFAELRSWKNRY